jgi:hypothetical protein
MIAHKVSMRTVAAMPGWDFTSLVSTAQLAITIGTQPIYSQRAPTTSIPPLHLRHSALANPSYQSTTTTTSSSSDALRPQTRVTTRKRKETTEAAVTEEKKCQYHPNSKTHSTEECRNKGKIQRENSPPKSKSPGISQSVPVPQSNQAPTRQQPPRQAKTTVATDLSQVQCFKCQQYGHFANKCPQNGKPQGNKRNNGRKTGVRRTRVTFKNLDQIPSDEDEKHITITNSAGQPLRPSIKTTTTNTQSE